VGEISEASGALRSTVSGGPRALVIEDDAGIAEAVVYALERDGFATASARTLREARAAVSGADLALLDLGLPDGSGFELLGEWRARGGPAVIVMTSRDGDVECVSALEAGADDFVAKPFSPRALVARARAVLRRAARSLPPAASGGALVVDLERRTATYRGRPLGLTKIELDLLAVLAGAPGRVHTRDQLVRRVWGDGYALDDRTVDSHVKGLRRKLVETGADAPVIVAVRGVGFKLATPS
jgi:DNA-binding response OmpR family regulator